MKTFLIETYGAYGLDITIVNAETVEKAKRDARFNEEWQEIYEIDTEIEGIVHVSDPDIG